MGGTYLRKKMCTSAPKFMLEDMYRETTEVMAHRVSMSVDVSGLLCLRFLLRNACKVPVNQGTRSIPWRVLHPRLTYSSKFLQCRPSCSSRASASFGPQVPAAELGKLTGGKAFPTSSIGGVTPQTA